MDGDAGNVGVEALDNILCRWPMQGCCCLLVTVAMLQVLIFVKLVMRLLLMMVSVGACDSHGNIDAKRWLCRQLWCWCCEMMLMELGLEYVSIIVQHDRKTIILVMFLMMVN